jgi:hypothetical protein
MFNWLPQDDVLRSLLAGAVYMLLQALGSWIAWGLTRWLEGQHSPAAIRLRRWRGWPLVGQGLGLALALAFPFLLVLGGLFSADDVGIRPVDWSVSLPWVLAVGAGSALWLALLWGSYWWRQRGSASATAWREASGHWANILPEALYHEAGAATFRAALIPLAGPYWGVWIAVLWKLLASRTSPRLTPPDPVGGYTGVSGASPQLNAKLRPPGQRELVYLGWALDWVGAILYLLSKSVWAALFGRALGQASVLAVTRLILRGSYQETPLAASANDQGHDDQGHEHGRREEPKAL